ncbi:hypothetical protein GDO86_008680 [Hymenochirus boettgeri]|uniref:Basic leucine zipper transcriptional factor ATF-like n=1 Tax=Hymenochirus boettgeri TaxID=247094 RepID=A0A8T2J2N8_9PIPI|nr:hypothetical protein GDO86_008680 [Hymenochirus boettgeri]
MKSTMKKGRKDATGTKASLDNRRGGSLLENHAVNGEVKKLKRRELNRLSACKSRKKHTEQADLLHQEHEKLEKANAALCKEIRIYNRRGRT